LLCVNTPEEDEEGYEEAKTFLEDLLYSNVFHMEYSNYGNYTDAYGRLLMWVYIEDESGEQILINKLIIEEGYGELMIIPPETCKEITEIIAN
jgi:endonuclease YncB( thermonuclease family)